ncbi:MAG: inner membrane CreD family protein [Verrucomicrobia bacterium]|nr:inner membrane CreD family protein [Verrucomicrobiota bacterium]
METTPSVENRAKFRRRNAVTLKLLFVAGLVLGLLVPLQLVNVLRQERAENRWRALHPEAAAPGVVTVPARRSPADIAVRRVDPKDEVALEGYRMVERSLKHGALVLALVFTAFFLFEVLASLRLHPVHYGLVGAALCLFYLALLALGEILQPGPAYVGAASASSLLITLYSGAVLRTWVRAGLIAGLLGAVHSVLYVVLRMEEFALLAGTAALFAALGAVMFFTRKIDWFAHEEGSPIPPLPAS